MAERFAFVTEEEINLLVDREKTKKSTSYAVNVFNGKLFVIVSGASSGGVPLKRCSAVHIQLAGKFIIASGLCWELLTFSSISSRAGWEILTFEILLLELSGHFLIILVPRAHDHSDLRQGSRALAMSNTGSPRFTDFPSNLANLIGWEYETNTLRMLRKTGPARALDLCRRSEGSWLWDDNDLLICRSKMRPKLYEYGTSMHFWLINCIFQSLTRKKSADSQLAGNFPTNVAGKWNFSYHPAGSAEQIFFPSNRKKKR